MKAFTKGQLVTLFVNYDQLGTVRVHDLVVHACGAKRLVLVNADGTKFAGRDFEPSVVQGSDDGASEVRPRMSAAETDAHALALGKRYAEHRRARIERAIAANAGNLPYVAAMRRDAEAIHEPRIVKGARDEAARTTTR